jgi:ABC-2 type transport system permease protein
MLIAVLALWMLKDREAGNAIFVVVGSALTGLWSSVLFVCGNSITQERWTGTLETLIGLPTPISVIVFGKNLAFTVQSLLSMLVSYLLAAWLFGFPLRVDQPFLFAISVVFMVISFVSLGMLIAPVFLISPAVQQWQNALDYPIYMLCGFLFPVALLPNWTTPLSYSLAPYWAARALHASSSGGDLGEIALAGPSWRSQCCICGDQAGIYSGTERSACRCDAGHERTPMRKLWLNIRLFFLGAVLSYIALFRWMRPVTYLASKVAFQGRSCFSACSDRLPAAAKT